MLVIHGLHGFMVTITWTTIADYVGDKGIDENGVVYILMSLPASDMAGRLSLTWVTDGGYMTQINFAVLCFSCMGMGEMLMVWSSGFVPVMLAVVVFAYAMGASQVVNTGVVDEFVTSENTAMALASRNILYAPLSLSVSPLIGKLCTVFLDQI